MCGSHDVAAAGGKLHELGARIFGLEAANGRGDVVNLLVRFRVMNIGKALLSTQDLGRCGWETVFPGDGHSHDELPYTESGEFLEMMSMDQRAGVWPVDEGGSSGSSGPAVPEDVEEGELVQELVAPTAPTATDREEHTASRHAVLRSWCRECCVGRCRCISIVPVEERARFLRLSLTAVT